MRQRGLTGRLPDMKLRPDKARRVLSRQDWRQMKALARDPDFLKSHGYIPYKIGASNFVCDHCPYKVRELWKIRNMDYINVLDLMAKFGEAETTRAIVDMHAEEDELSRNTSNVCLRILEACGEDLDNNVQEALTPQSIADKYIARPRKSRFLAKSGR